MRPSIIVCPVAVAWMLVQAGTARAEFIPWQYNWSRSPTTIMADAPGTGYIQLTDEVWKSAAGSSDIVATNIKVFSDAPKANPDVFTQKNYTLTLTILDENSGTSGSLVFTGYLHGTASSKHSAVENVFTGLTTQSLVLGDSLYTVTMGSYVPPGPPGSVNSGAISAFASVTVSSIHKTPEPSTLVLASLGLPLFGWPLWWQRRRRNRRLLLLA